MVVSLFITDKETSSQSIKEKPDFSESDRWSLAVDLSDAGLVSMGSRFVTCREKSAIYVCNSCGDIEIIPTSCNVRFCPRCNSKLFKKLQEKFGESMDLVTSPSFLSLSVPNFLEINRCVLRKLRAWFSRLRRRKSFASVRGGFYDFDATFSYDSNWNLHIHAVIDCFWLDRDAVLSDWLEITKELGGETRNLYIERAYTFVSRNGFKSKVHWTPNSRPEIKKRILASCSNYLVHHAVKAPDVPTVHHLASYIIACYHSRLLQGFGSLFDLPSAVFHKICNVCGGFSWSFVGFLDRLQSIADSMTGLEVLDWG